MPLSGVKYFNLDELNMYTVKIFSIHRVYVTGCYLPAEPLISFHCWCIYCCCFRSCVVAHTVRLHCTTNIYLLANLVDVGALTVMVSQGMRLSPPNQTGQYSCDVE